MLIFLVNRIDGQRLSGGSQHYHHQRQIAALYDLALERIEATCFHDGLHAR